MPEYGLIGVLRTMSSRGIASIDIDEHNHLVITYTDGTTQVSENAIGCNEVTPEEYGAYGDGIHDDAPALSAALRTGKNVKLTQDLYLFSPIFIKAQKNVSLDGCGYTLHANMNNVMVDSADNNLYEVLVFSAGKTSNTSSPLREVYDSRDLYISDIVSGERAEPDPSLTETIKIGYLSYDGKCPLPTKYQEMMDEDYIVVEHYNYMRVMMENFTLECTKCRGRYGMVFNNTCDSIVRNVKVISTDGEGQQAAAINNCYNFLVDGLWSENFWAEYTWMTSDVDPVYGRGNNGYGLIATGDIIRIKNYTGWNTKSNLTIGGNRTIWTTNLVVDGMHCGWKVNRNNMQRTSLDGQYSTWRYESAWNCHEDAICPVINNVTIDMENCTLSQYPFSIRCPEAVINNVNITAPEGQIMLCGICEHVSMTNIIAPDCVVALGWDGASIIIRDMIATNCHFFRIEQGDNGANTIVLNSCIIEQRIYNVNHLKATNTTVYGRSKTEWPGLVPMVITDDAFMTNCSVYASRSEFVGPTQPLVDIPNEGLYLTNCRMYVPLWGTILRPNAVQSHILGMHREDVHGLILDSFEFGLLDYNDLQ